MRIIKSIMRYAIVENNGKFFVMSRDSKENKSFENQTEAEAYFEKLTNWITLAQANAPSWD